MQDDLQDDLISCLSNNQYQIGGTCNAKHFKLNIKTALKTRPPLCWCHRLICCFVQFDVEFLLWQIPKMWSSIVGHQHANEGQKFRAHRTKMLWIKLLSLQKVRLTSTVAKRRHDFDSSALWWPLKYCCFLRNQHYSAFSYKDLIFFFLEHAVTWFVLQFNPHDQTAVTRPHAGFLFQDRHCFGLCHRELWVQTTATASKTFSKTSRILVTPTISAIIASRL